MDIWRKRGRCEGVASWLGAVGTRVVGLGCGISRADKFPNDINDIHYLMPIYILHSYFGYWWLAT